MYHQINQLKENLLLGSHRALARAITIVENDLDGSEELLLSLTQSKRSNVIGITGPPGAGKSTLVNELIAHWTERDKKVAVLAVDPSSPFNFGALLGDRIRMSGFYNHPKVFIRSLASRGSLGGLTASFLEVVDVVKEAGFDWIIVETVGVGQSEVEVAGMANCTVVVLVPEAGDEIQTLKSGLMEIADVFAVNKADRPDATTFYNHLRLMVHEKALGQTEVPVIQTIASNRSGVDQLAEAIEIHLGTESVNNNRQWVLLLAKCYQLLQKKLLKKIDVNMLESHLKSAFLKTDFNIYHFINKY